VRPRLAAALLALGASAGPALAAEIPGALVVLEVLEPARPGFVPEAAPPRFVLLEEGQVVVGGTSALYSGTLSRTELGELEKRLAAVRRLAAPARLAFGAGERHFRLRLLKGKALELQASGDPAAAAPDQQQVARLLADLAAFDHASLRPLAPSGYVATAVEQSLPGGCRKWTLPVALPELVAGPRQLTAAEAASWPTGANAASVCERDRRYAVTFRPLLPGERP